MRALLCGMAACLALAAARCVASGTNVQFIVVDPSTGLPLRDACVALAGPAGSVVVPAGAVVSLPGLALARSPERTLVIAAGKSLVLQQPSEPPVKDIYITVTASRLARPATEVSSGTTRSKQEITKFGGAQPGGDIKQVTKTTAGVAADSASQVHIRGEHTSITYVVDGIPLPDTLSGRQGAIVVPSTIESVDILLGGFAPEYGGQTAAILDIATLPRARHARSDLVFDGGTFNTVGGDLTMVGPIGNKLGYVIDLAGTRTDAIEEPQQPDNDTAHNAGADQSGFGKFTYQQSAKDRFSFTMSTNPDRMQIGNRTGLPDSFADSGEGYGFLGLRNRDGHRPDAGNGGLGSEDIVLPSQQDAGMDITQREANEFATASWRRQIDERTVGLVGVVFLHSGQDVTNDNPAVNLLNLPVDDSVEYNPTVAKNVHHVQLTASMARRTAGHSLKFGGLFDSQGGHESYQITPASQLALDALAATAPNLAPPGHLTGDIDVDGYPVYIADSNTSPTLNVSRSGYYGAAYAQDTWKPGRLTLNYGLRADWYRQSQNLGQAPVDDFELSPRLNMSYFLGRASVLRASYDKLFNAPPLAQGAVVGQSLQPPTINQYDISIEHRVGPNQQFKAAYYYKQMHNQIDVGLLIPGSWIGLYAGVNDQFGAVHGLELSYDISAPKGIGWDAYFNYTLSAAKPNGVDNTGANVPDYNDHDQRHTVGVGLAYTWKSGASAAGTFDYGSGLASSPIPPSTSRVARTNVDLNLTTGPRLFRSRGGLQVGVLNVFDTRTVINFQSAFSGTRFQLSRRFMVSAFLKL